MWKLVIEDDEGKRTVVPLSRDDYTIGRQDGNTIRLTERNVSREHARVKRQRKDQNGQSKDVFVLEDCSSYNGAFVNGVRVGGSQELQNGDLVQIGDYRLVLQDDAAAAEQAVPASPSGSIKATMPMGSLRGALLTERPNRLVMLVGPTPGVEFPLDRERLTIGRAEDSTISVNHNSVSRLHCEIHSFGDGRFEIVDKGSSNGVRVNAVELRRSIIEAGDTIELGDVRFKFVGAGQVFVPGPNESQQLTAISDREADIVTGERRGAGAYALPILLAVVLGAGAVVAFAYVLRSRAGTEPATAAVVDQEQAIMAEAQRTCLPDDCELAHQALHTLPQASVWRNTNEFRDVERTWAASLLRKSAAASDVDAKKQLLSRVATASTVDPALVQQAKDQLASLEGQAPVATPSQLPTALPSDTPPVHSDVAPVAQAAPPATTRAPRRPEPASHPTLTSATAPPPATPKSSVLDRAQKAILDGRPQEARALLESKGVRSGHGTPEEVRLLKALCSSPPDAVCLEDLKRAYAK